MRGMRQCASSDHSSTMPGWLGAWTFSAGSVPCSPPLFGHRCPPQRLPRSAEIYSCSAEVCGIVDRATEPSEIIVGCPLAAGATPGGANCTVPLVGLATGGASIGGALRAWGSRHRKVLGQLRDFDPHRRQRHKHERLPARGSTPGLCSARRRFSAERCAA